MAVKVAINGFGRIGRLVLRAIVESGRKDIEVVSINDLGPVETNAHLLRFDSVHGRFPHEVGVDGDSIVVGGQQDQGDGDQGSDPAAAQGARRRHRAGVHRHLHRARQGRGASDRRRQARARLRARRKAPTSRSSTASTTSKLTKEHLVVSNASCTTNCLAPVAKVLNDAIGIEHGFMTTIHSYTGDQPTLDTLHKDLYRARAAALSMIPTTTGAAKAVGLVLPELKGKLDGSAIRVPTPNVSVVDLKFVAKRATTKDEINEAIKAAANGPLKGILGYHRQAQRLHRLQPRQPFLGLPSRPDQGDRRHVRAHPVLVRQRMGLLEPHGRHRGRARQADLTNGAEPAACAGSVNVNSCLCRAA